MSTNAGRHPYQQLGLPAEAVRYLGEAYFEAGDHFESAHSVVIIDSSLLAA